MDYRDRDENSRTRAERPERETKEENKSIKTVTIRGVDGQIYDEFSQVIQASGMTMGDAVSKMMRDVSKDFDEVFPMLSAMSLKYMVKKDKITVKHYLTIKSDVTTEAFETYIDKIEHCETVRVPQVLPKLLIYSKIAHCDRVEIYPRIEGDPNESAI